LTLTGKIDAIITKSVSRFGCNTVDTLNFTRELKALGIDMYFEKENLHSISPDGEHNN
jgi:DNA invertase Pin-like site-specific DNA recombinase